MEWSTKKMKKIVAGNKEGEPTHFIVSDKEPRYKVVEATGHQCCFDYAVADTTETTPNQNICECYTKEQAEQIASSLNELDAELGISPCKWCGKDCAEIEYCKFDDAYRLETGCDESFEAYEETGNKDYTRTRFLATESEMVEEWNKMMSPKWDDFGEMPNDHAVDTYLCRERFNRFNKVIKSTGEIPKFPQLFLEEVDGELTLHLCSEKPNEDNK